MARITANIPQFVAHSINARVPSGKAVNWDKLIDSIQGAINSGEQLKSNKREDVRTKLGTQTSPDDFLDFSCGESGKIRAVNSTPARFYAGIIRAVKLQEYWQTNIVTIPQPYVDWICDKFLQDAPKSKDSKDSK